MTLGGGCLILFMDIRFAEHIYFLHHPVAGGTTHYVWHKLVPSKTSLFTWCLLQDRIPTKSNLVRRRVLQPTHNMCVGRCGNIETTDHLFIGCNVFGSVWYLLCN